MATPNSLHTEMSALIEHWSNRHPVENICSTVRLPNGTQIRHTDGTLEPVPNELRALVPGETLIVPEATEENALDRLDWVRSAQTYSRTALPEGVPAPSLEQMERVSAQIRTTCERQIEVIYLSPQLYGQFAETVNGLHPPSADQGRIVSFQGIPVTVSPHLPPGQHCWVVGQGAVAAYQELCELLEAHRQETPPDSGVFTERASTVDHSGETTPFTDDDFDKLIEDIEGLIDEHA